MKIRLNKQAILKVNLPEVPQELVGTKHYSIGSHDRFLDEIRFACSPAAEKAIVKSWWSVYFPTRPISFREEDGIAWELIRMKVAYYAAAISSILQRVPMTKHCEQNYIAAQKMNLRGFTPTLASVVRCVVETEREYEKAIKREKEQPMAKKILVVKKAAVKEEVKKEVVAPVKKAVAAPATVAPKAPKAAKAPKATPAPLVKTVAKAVKAAPVKVAAKIPAPAPKAKSKTAVVTVNDSWVSIFKAQPKMKLTDTQIAAEMSKRHPECKQYTTTDVALRRSSYNHGRLTCQKGVAPTVQIKLYREQDIKKKK